MTSQSALCRLCFNNAEDKNLQVINTNIQDMLRTLLINIDVTANENPVICWACHRKLEKHYCFKKKCIFTEDTLSPFVAEYVKINLNEIRNQIIKSEVEVEKNVCRLCLQYSDDDITLNEDETQQFQGFFPEINLNLTNFVILCLTCYNTLHKYFTFVSSFYSNQISGGNHKSSMNVEESAENLLLTGEMGMKSEAVSSERLDEKFDIGVEEIINIKSEDTKWPLMDVEENDDHDIKPMLLHEEFDVKCDGDSSDKEFLFTNSSNINISYRGLEEPNCNRINSEYLLKKNCTDRQKDIVHTDSSKIQTFKCDKCEYETKLSVHFRKHISVNHTYPPKIQIYPCEECNFKREYKAGLKSHVICCHTDPSKVKMYKCDQCDYESKSSTNLKTHVLMKHTHPFKIQMYKCEECSFETKQKACLKNHLITRHTSPEPAVHKCDKCQYQSKLRSGLTKHIRYHHTDPSKIKMHKCDQCDYETRLTANLKRHILSFHTNPSEITMYKCDKCNYEFKIRDDLRKHCVRKHTDPSEILMHKCNECSYESKWRESLRNHYIRKHMNSSEIQMIECKECSYKTKHKADMKLHMLTHATNLSEITMYKCDKCDFETKWRKNLKQHFIRKHID